MEKKQPVITVLQVVPRLEAGGVERGVLEIAKALKQAGYNSIVCSAGGAMVKPLEADGSIHVTLPVDSKNPWKMLCNIFRLRRVISKHKVDIIHARSRAPAWSCRFAVFLSRCKFITTFHGTYGAKWWFKRWYNSSMLKGEKIIAISPFIFDHIRDVYHHDMRNVVVINRGVDLEEFAYEKISQARLTAAAEHLGIDAKEERKRQRGVPVTNRLLLPARFTRWKGHAYLLHILHLLKGHDDYICYMVGSLTPDHERYLHHLREMIGFYNLEQNVIIRPHYRDMAALYAMSDIVLSMSQEPEAFGRTIVEAQAMGKLVIATEHGGASYTIEHGQNGYLIPVHDPATAALVLGEALHLDSGTREEIIRNGLESVQASYSSKRMCDKTLKLYRQLAGTEK